MKAIKKHILAAIFVLLACVTIAYAGIQAYKGSSAHDMLKNQALSRLPAGYTNFDIAL